jgi:hypothetical protein
MALLNDRTADPVTYDGENAADRRARRLRFLTPTSLDEGERA